MTEWAPPPRQPEEQPPTRWAPPEAPPSAPPNGWDQPPAGYGPPPSGYGGYGSPPPGYGPPPSGLSWGAPPAHKPGIAPLRPLSLNELLDGGFQAIRTNPRTMIGISAVVLVIISLLGLLPLAWARQSLTEALPRAIQNADLAVLLDSISNLALAALPSALLVQLATLVLDAVLAVAVGAAVLGRKTSPGQLWAATRRRLPATIGFALVTLLIRNLGGWAGAAVLIVPGLLLIRSGADLPGVVLIMLGLIGGGVLAVLLWVKLALAAPALLLENLSVPATLARSWRLVRGSFWRVLLILVVVTVIVSVTATLIELPFSGLSQVWTALQPGQASFAATVTATTITAVGQTVANAVLGPWSAAATTLLYLDLRMRREGMDLELLRTPGPGTGS